MRRLQLKRSRQSGRTDLREGGAWNEAPNHLLFVLASHAPRYLETQTTTLSFIFCTVTISRRRIPKVNATYRTQYRFIQYCRTFKPHLRCAIVLQPSLGSIYPSLCCTHSLSSASSLLWGITAITKHLNYRIKIGVSHVGHDLCRCLSKQGLTFVAEAWRSQCTVRTLPRTRTCLSAIHDRRNGCMPKPGLFATTLYPIATSIVGRRPLHHLDQKYLKRIHCERHLDIYAFLEKICLNEP